MGTIQMSHIYGLRKFKLALNHLVAAGDIHSRLRSAIYQELIHLSVDDVPQALQSDLEALKEKFYAQRDLIEGMSEIEAEHTAENIVQMFSAWIDSTP